MEVDQILNKIDAVVDASSVYFLDASVVEITAQDIAGDEEFEEADEDDSQGTQTETKIQTGNQSEASDDSLYGNESLVMNFNWEESQLESDTVESQPSLKKVVVESEPEWSTLYKTQNKTLLGEKDKPQIIKVPLSEVRQSEYTMLESKRVQCNRCPSNSKHIKNIRRHIRISHRDTTYLYKCPFCHFTSKHYNSVSLHIISKHKSDNELVYFECHTCGKRFKFKTHLIRHMNIHRTKRELMRTNDMHKCQECDRLFRYKYNMKRHTENSHREKERILEKLKCYNCFYRCKDKRSILSHIQKCHTPPEQLETLKCPECNYTTKFDADLRNHKKVKHHSQRQNKNK